MEKKNNDNRTPIKIKKLTVDDLKKATAGNALRPWPAKTEAGGKVERSTNQQ